MLQRRCLRHAVILCLAVFTMGLVVSGAPASADAFSPSLAVGAAIPRGAPFFVIASGLEAGRSYTLTVDGGHFVDSGTSMLTAAAGDDGTLWVGVTGTESVSPATAGIDVTLSDTDDVSAPLATAVKSFSAPTVSASLCPGVGSPLAVSGLADGDYRFESTSATFDPTLVHAASPSVLTTVTAATNVAATSNVTLRSVQQPNIAYTLDVTRAVPQLTLPNQPQYSPWQLRYTASCFAPGETVAQASHSSNATGVRAVADAYGTARITVDLHPAAQGRPADAVVFRGAISGQTVTVDHAQVLGTTLYEGQYVSSVGGDAWQRGRLLAAASPDTSAAGRPNFVFSGGCNPGLFTIFPDGGGSTVWQAFPSQIRNGNCRLTFERGGDLVLRNAVGTTTWTSRTHGTRSGNRFVVTNLQKAEIITGTQVAMWTTDFGPVSTPLSAMLRQVGALHRGQTIGWGTVRFGLDRHGNVVVTRAGKVVWVQHTAGLGGIRLRMLDTGELVLRTARHRTVWSTHTRSANAVVEVEANGDVGIFSQHGHHLLWRTGTAI